MTKIIKEVNEKSAIESIQVDNEKLTVTARTRNLAEQLIALYEFAMGAIERNQQKLEFDIKFCLIIENASINYPKPHRMFIMTGKLDTPMKLLEPELSPDVYNQLVNAVKNNPLQKIEEKKEEEQNITLPINQRRL